MCRIFLQIYSALVDVSWLEVIKAAAPIVTAAIAFLALKNWRRQDRARREAEFLDALVDAVHAYIAEMSRPIGLLQIAKIGMHSYAPTWESGDEKNIRIRGAIAYIQKRGEEDAKRLGEAIESAQPFAIKLKSIAAKGQIFNFTEYKKCQNAVEMLTWHLGRIQALASIIGSPTLNWENDDVLRTLNKVMDTDQDEIINDIRQRSIEIIQFSRNIYSSLYD